MPLYHLHVGNVSRRSGRSVVAAAAYRSGQRLTDSYYGKIHDYTHKGGVIHTEILLPQNAPDEFYDRQILWNSVELAERRWDARLAREVEVALPVELSLEQNISLVQKYVKQCFVEWGMCADICIHDKGNGNPHAHILLTTRPINRDGFCKKKNRDWEKWGNVKLWREQWAHVQNTVFEQMELGIRVNHKSYKERGIDREPTIHLGPKVIAIEKHGKQLRRGIKYREIVQYNREREHGKEKSLQKQRDFERTR